MKKSIFIVMFVLMASLNAYAYDKDKVHPLLNEKAALQSQNFIAVLMSLGYKEQFPYDILTASYINGHTIKEWLRLGGTQEDAGLRSIEHFHDPTKTWDGAGLKNTTGSSSLLWAQNPNQSIATGNWSWPSAQNYYYQALISSDTAARAQNLADTFRSLGQVIHLLSDASVPEHTRNDIHVFPWLDNKSQSFPQIGSWTYETWCKWNVQYLNTNATSTSYAIANTSVISGLDPIFNFWDTTPEPINSSFIPVGLAEYSNYNFLSSDTIFRDYVYPVKPNHFVETAVAEDGVTEKRIYFQGATSDNKVITHLASTGYLWAELSQIPASEMDDSRFSLDDRCFKDYADILVPKAVSYSTGLLNYFFRGSIEISLPDDGVYGIAAPDGTFTKIKLNARNSTANGEEMISGTGTLQLVVKYKVAATNPYQPDFSCPSTATQEFTYIVASESTGVTSLPTGTPIPLTFNLPGSGIPLWASDVYIQVVYKGQLGNEADAVAVGYRDISEPTPKDITNVYDCSNKTINNDYLSFNRIYYADPGLYSAYFPSIPPGHYGRVFILSEYYTGYSYSNFIDNSVTEVLYGYGFWNQTDPTTGVADCGSHYIDTWRGLNYWESCIYFDYSCSVNTDLIGPVPVVIPE